jgi:Protein of unknown function (DUF1559)
LPFVEQQALHDRIESGGEADTGGNLIGPGGPVAWSSTYLPWAVQIKVVICPSDKPVLGGSNAKNSYAFSLGDSVGGNVTVGGLNTQHNSATTYTRGLFGGSQRCKGFNHVSDGTSNTIAMSERVWGNNLGVTASTGQDVRTATAQNVTTIITNPGSCYAQASGNFFTGTPIKARFGACWQDGQAERVGFTTVLPPNAPSCVSNADVNADSNGGVLNPSSYHNNGVMALMTDGAVRFVTNNINCGNIAAGQVTAGPSPYGVWGAIGSTEGREPQGDF